MTEHRFDRGHNTYFDKPAALRDAGAGRSQEVESLIRILQQGDPAGLREALPKIQRLDTASLLAVAPELAHTATTLTEPELREAAQALLKSVFASAAGSQPGLDGANSIGEPLGQIQKSPFPQTDSPAWRKAARRRAAERAQKRKRLWGSPSILAAQT